MVVATTRKHKKIYISELYNLIYTQRVWMVLLFSSSTSDIHTEDSVETLPSMELSTPAYVLILFAWIQQLTSLCILQNRLGNICLSKFTR